MIPHLRYENACDYYRQTRRRAFDRVRDSLVGRGLVSASFSLSGVDARTVDAWERTWRGTQHWSLKGGFPWAALQRRYCRKPRNFHCALWYGESLCGLAVGKLSEGHEVLCLHYMEGNPDPDHPLRGNVADVVFACAHLYGVAVGAKCLCSKNPIPRLKRTMRSLALGLRTRTEKRDIAGVICEHRSQETVMSPYTVISPDAPQTAAIGRAHGIRRSRHALAHRHPSPALVRAIAEADARVAAAPDPLAYLTPERFAANRQSGRGDTLGVGPQLAPR